VSTISFLDCDKISLDSLYLFGDKNMSFAPIDSGLAKSLSQKLEALAKSFAAGYQGIQNAGRTGVSALAAEQLDPVMRSITIEDKDFLLTKDIPTLKATQSVYQYNVKTAVRSGVDLAGWEAFLPQEDASQYMRVAEVLKVYGIRKSITQMAMFINDAGGYSVDLEKENDQNAALAMAEALERDLYVGGDLFMDAQGEVDPYVSTNINGPIRQVRGIQANIREGNQSQRGIPGDFVGYGNNRSVTFDRRGGVLERGFLDKIVTAVRDSRGAVREGHCTTSQLAEFRATFFPIERANLGEAYGIRGAAVTNDEHAKFTVDTVGGPMDFIPTVFKYLRSRAEPVIGSVGTPPSTPAIAVAVGASVTNSGFQPGETYSYRVQAANIAGLSQGSTSTSVTFGGGDANKPAEVTITNAPGVEYYLVFRTPQEATGTLAGKEMFIGKILPSFGGSTIFRDNNRIIPGLDSILFLPRDKNRAKLATLGNLLNKLQLGVRGLAFETVYASYCGCVVDRPRTFALADNVYQQREGL
jgi:hypothetical protein